MSVDVSVVTLSSEGERAVVSQRAGSTVLDTALEPLLAGAAAKSLRSLKINLLSFVQRDGDYKSTKPPIHWALTQLGARLERAELPQLEELVVGPLFIDALPTKPAPAPLRLEKAPRLSPSPRGYLEVLTQAWVQIVDATPRAESFGHTKGLELPLNIETRLELAGHLIQEAGTYCDESPAERRGRPWKVTRHSGLYADYAVVYWGPGWRILDASTVNDVRIDERDINLVPGDVVTSRFGELTLKLCAR